MINPFEERSNALGDPIYLLCPDDMYWNPNLIIQWTHLQDGTGPAHYTCHDLDIEIGSFWKEVGALFGTRAFSNVVAFRDDIDKSSNNNKDFYSHFDSKPLTKNYIEQDEFEVQMQMIRFDYVTNYDGYDSAWKALVQASTKQEGNIFGWNQPYTEGVSRDDIVRIVTLHTPSVGKMRGDSCPDDSYFWGHCRKVQNNASWHDKFNPGGTYNLPSFDDGANQIDPDMIIKVLVSNAGNTDRDINYSQRWWMRTLCRLRERGLTNVGYVHYTYPDFFNEARAQIVRKGCIPYARETKIEAPTESIVTAEDQIVQQDGLKAPSLTLECPAGYKRKDNFLLQWMHIQDGTADSYYHRHSINEAVRNFWDGIGVTIKDRAYSSLVAYSDSKEETDADETFWVHQSPFQNYSSSPRNVLDGLDSFSFDKSFDGYTGGWKALIQASSTQDDQTMFGWNSPESQATSDKDKMRIITLHTHAPGKIKLDEGQNKHNYCPNSHEWEDCYNVQVKSEWSDKYNPIGKYNLPRLWDGVQQMDKTVKYVILVSHTRDTHEYYSDAKTKWNDVACYMTNHGYDVTVLDDSPHMFDDLYEEFVRKSCVPR